MVTRTLAKSLYGLFGALYLAAGASALLLNTGVLPDAVRDLILEVGRGDLNTLHIMQEFGSTLVFVGLVTFWFIRHYEVSRPFHWAMTVFWGLVALVHWFDVRGPVPSVVGPLINTVPFSLFVAVGLLRLRSEGGTDSGDEHPRHSTIVPEDRACTARER
jgi:hypothetical protein